MLCSNYVHGDTATRIRRSGSKNTSFSAQKPCFFLTPWRQTCWKGKYLWTILAIGQISETPILVMSFSMLVLSHYIDFCGNFSSCSGWKMRIILDNISVSMNLCRQTTLWRTILPHSRYVTPFIPCTLLCMKLYEITARRIFSYTSLLFSPLLEGITRICPDNWINKNNSIIVYNSFGRSAEGFASWTCSEMKTVKITVFTVAHITILHTGLKTMGLEFKHFRISENQIDDTAIRDP